MDDPRIAGLDPASPLPANDDVVSSARTTQATPGPFGRVNPYPGDTYHQTFTPEVKKAIVDAVQFSYEIVQERHDESLGYGPNTFGHNVYYIGKFQLAKCCERSGGKLERVEDLNSLFRFQSGGYTLGFYKVGRTADQNIWEEFPTSENGAMSISEEGYPFLVGLEDSMLDRVDALRYVVVAHLGNPTSGLCAIYLCIPIKTENGKIKRWGYAEALYLRDKGLGSTPLPSIPPPPENPSLPLTIEEEPEADVIVTAK